MFEVWEKMSGYECGKRIIQQKEDTGMGSPGRKQLENTSNRLEKLETKFSLMSHKVVLQNEEIHSLKESIEKLTTMVSEIQTTLDKMK